MQNKKTDIEIIETVLSGKREAFTEIIKRHQQFVFTMALRFTKNREDAEEIAQDTFIKAFRYLKSYQKESKLSTWLYSITYNTSLSFLKKKKIKTTSIDNEESYTQIEDNESGFNSIEKKSQMFHVNKAIALLLPDDALVITLFYKGEQSIEEISKIMGLEKNAVKVKLYRARHRLKNKLEILLQKEVRDLL